MKNRVANPAFDRSKIIALIAWIFLLARYWWYTNANRLTPSQTMQILINFVSESPYGLLTYTLIYMIRPVFLFPATLVTMAATYLYGPVRGIAYALIASNLSTMVAFLIERFFGVGFSEYRPTLVHAGYGFGEHSRYDFVWHVGRVHSGEFCIPKRFT